MIKRAPRLPVLKSGTLMLPKPKDAARTKRGAFKSHRDNREVCYNTAVGRLEYRMRTILMAERQFWICPACKMAMYPHEITFQHGKTRGMGGGVRDDRISTPGNEAWHYFCNAKRGSQRTV